MWSEVTQKIRLVLVGTTHPGNIGASARAMKVMGLRRLYLVAPQRFPNAEATAMASGADDLLTGAKICETLEEALADCALVIGTSARQRSIAWPVLTPAAAAQEICAATLHGEVAVLFGREHSGLSNAEVDLCQSMIEIPTSSDFRSLNLAAAVQLIAYEIRSAGLELNAETVSNGDDPGDAPPATANETTDLVRHLVETRTQVEFFDPRKPRRLPRRIRRLANRARLDHEEVQIVRGFLAAIQNKLKR